MNFKERGFTLIIVLTILAVLSLLTLSTFEQAQWVKRSAYFVWQQVKMQDRTWQALTVAERQLSARLTTRHCFAPYSVSNDYFFLHQKGEGACTTPSTDQSITIMYESLPEISCVRIRNQSNLKADFFRVTVHSENPAFKQKIILQSVFVLASKAKNKPFQLDNAIECIKTKQYEVGRQSWLLQ